MAQICSKIPFMATFGPKIMAKNPRELCMAHGVGGCGHHHHPRLLLFLLLPMAPVGSFRVHGFQHNLRFWRMVRMTIGQKGFVVAAHQIRHRRGRFWKFFANCWKILLTERTYLGRIPIEFQDKDSVHYSWSIMDFQQNFLGSTSNQDLARTKKHQVRVLVSIPWCFGHVIKDQAGRSGLPGLLGPFSSLVSGFSPCHWPLVLVFDPSRSLVGIRKSYGLPGPHLYYSGTTMVL